MLPEVGNIFDDKYKIIGVLGQGGFARSFLGEDLVTHNMVVLKFPDITQLGDPAVYERFMREINIGKLLNHPDLPVALFYSEGSPPYLVLKYVEGESLAEIISKGKIFSVNEAVKLVSMLLEALQYCHESGVYHRDIKPENIVLGSDRHLKIIDFGIAGLAGAPRVTFRGFSSMMGTPEYMSPEQIKGERGGAGSDIYAVGCLMYCMLAGKPPFTGDNPLTVMYQHMTSDPESLMDLRRDVSPELWAVIKRSLRRRKEERYESAFDMAEELRHPEKADLSYINKSDPPLQSIATTRKSSWFILFGLIITSLVLIVIFLLLRNKM